METVSPSPSSSSADQEEAPTYDEISLQQSLLFSHSLKELKNLRSQLYSAAEYFELSYSNDDQKQLVMNTLKDYALGALVNTVDHLGSISYKVNDLLNEKVDAVSGTEFRVSCIEQRLRTCQESIDQEGRSQQSLVIRAPQYHKHYILPVGETIIESGRHAIPTYQELNPPRENGGSQQFQTVVHSTIRERAPSFRRLHSPSPSPSHSFSTLQRVRSLSPFQEARSPSPSPQIGKFSFKEKRAVSPPPNSKSFAHTISLPSRTNFANSSNIGRWHPSETQKSSPMHLHAETNHRKESDRNSKKSRGFLKALLTRRRSRNDESLYSYLDEY